MDAPPTYTLRIFQANTGCKIGITGSLMVGTEKAGGRIGRLGRDLLRGPGYELAARQDGNFVVGLAHPHLICMALRSMLFVTLDEGRPMLPNG